MTEQQKTFPKIQVIKTVRQFTSLGLLGAKKLVEDVILASKMAGQELSVESAYAVIGEYHKGGVLDVLHEADSLIEELGIYHRKARLYLLFATVRLERYKLESK